ncbi:hypothetical protein H8356DRAFT_1331036 [Neocallimastix lanati (nom. inval.)]|nr:hypothetical protein H8356DRAFT_1331036 [Neocallimastix sp. JGI-2020a]
MRILNSVIKLKNNNKTIANHFGTIGFNFPANVAGILIVSVIIIIGKRNLKKSTMVSILKWINPVFNFKIRQTNNFKFNQNANHLQNQLWLRAHCRTDPNNVNHILNNVIIAQKIKEQNQELAHFFCKY